MTNSFEFDDFIKFSQRLLENKNIVEDNFQCVYRTILSRVYYAAFNHTKYWLELNVKNFKTREFNFETGRMQNKRGLSEHVQVFKELRVIAKDQKDLKNQFRNASSKLEFLFDKRIQADYDEDLIFEEIEVTDAIQDAIYIINLLPFN